MVARARVLGVSSYLPPRVRTSAEVEAMVSAASPDCRVRRGIVEAISGIRQRRVIDDGVQIRIYTDSDGDGFGSGLSMLACTVIPGWSTRAGDCNDANFLIYPGAGYCVGPTSYAICSITGTAPVSIPCPVATPTCEALSGGYVRCR